MIDLKPKIIRVALDGFGEIFLRKPTARLSLRIAEFNSNGGPESADKRNLLSLAEAVSDCLVDDQGNKILASSEQALELEADLFIAIGNKLRELMTPNLAVTEKNSLTAPIEYSPTGSPSSSDEPTSIGFSKSSTSIS